MAAVNLRCHNTTTSTIQQHEGPKWASCFKKWWGHFKILHKLAVNHQHVALIMQAYSSASFARLKTISNKIDDSSCFSILSFLLSHGFILWCCSPQIYSTVTSSSVAQPHWNRITNSPYSFFSTHLQTFLDYSVKDTWSLFYERDLCSFSSSASAVQTLVSVWVAIVNGLLWLPCGSLLLPFSCMFIRMSAGRKNKDVDKCHLIGLKRISEFKKRTEKNDT